jgi:arylsulfatase A-like enzyme
MTDFMATFADMLDHELPGNAGEDSYSIMPVLLGEKYDKPLRESTVHHSGAGAFAIRKGDWKIIFGLVEHGERPDDPSNWTKKGYLFNLKEDPYETNDLYDKHPEIVKELNQLLYSYSIL